MINKIKFKHGFFEITIKSWEHLTSIITDLDRNADLIFRGQEEQSFNLESSLFRLKKDVTKKEIIEHLNNFRNESRRLLKLPLELSTSDEEIWAIGQHNNLATPLLDWTYSPYVALYFALFKKTTQTNASLFILNLNAIETLLLYKITEHLYWLPNNVMKELDILSSLNDIENESILYAQAVLDVYHHKFTVSLETELYCKEIVNEILYSAVKIVAPKSGENSRLINQRALFTYSLSSEPLEKLIHEYFYESNEKVLLKINIPSHLQEISLYQLSLMNIQHASLFPDLFGAAEFCNSKFKINKKIDQSISIKHTQPEYKFSDFKIFFDKIYSTLNSLDDAFVELPKDSLFDTHHPELLGITNGEYYHTVYTVFRNLLSPFPFSKLDSIHELVFWSIFNDTKDLFLDFKNDDILEETTIEFYMNFYTAITGHDSIIWEVDDDTDEIVTTPMPNPKNILTEQWKEAWFEIEEKLLGEILNDDFFMFCDHFTQFSKQPYNPTLAEYRVALTWLQKVQEISGNNQQIEYNLINDPIMNYQVKK